MAIRADSYSSTSEVKAFTRHLLDGQSAFNSTTRPTSVELEKFIDRASGALNSAIPSIGYSAAAVRANSTAKLACDDWVTAQAAMYVEMTQRGTGFSDAEGSRTWYFKGLYGRATEFLKEFKLSFANMNIPKAFSSSNGLQFTGLDAQADRSDQHDTGRAQPFAQRGQFDNP